VFVIDASMTLAWCFDDETTDQTESLLRRLLLEGAMAPAHWSLEVANGLVTGERRGRVGRVKLGASRAFLEDLRVDVVPTDLDAVDRATRIAVRHGLTTYDAAYLDLAQARGLALATLDQNLAGACRKERVRLLSA
jgi:predicted nucleic acid-binding protein